MITAGYLLSPLSWWNDLFVNIPIAYLFAFGFGIIHKSLFVPMLIIGYWITNVAGFMLMHYGFKRGFVKPDKTGTAGLRPNNGSQYTMRSFYRDIAVSLVYTLAVAVFVKLGWLRFPLNL